MSGGSFNYLYCKEAHELFDHSRIVDIHDMAMLLIIEGHKDIAKDLLRLKETLEKAITIVEVKLESLAIVMKAVEYWQSGDHGRETFEKIMDAYRQGK
jgi:hypothetical protein